jgi:tRNA uridine 5-carboxymethylaminomethyl modification enzyme
MFTSRAEHRLMLRADNAADRLTPRAAEWGLLAGTALGRARLERLRTRGAAMERLHRRIDATRVDGRELAGLIRSQDFGEADLARVIPDAAFDAGVRRTVLADRRYEAYVTRARAEIRRHAEMEHRRLPDGLPYERLANLRTEARHALARFRPATFGQASRLEGITPADLTLLAVLADRWRRETRGGAPA